MKRNLIVAGLLVLMISMVAVAGCGNKDEKADTVVVAHDCAGDCGMTKMTPEQTKEIDGKFYCTGCAKKLEAEDAHKGHNH